MTGSPSTSPDANSPPIPIPAGGRAAGRLTVPPSKSVTHRFLNLALLARAAGAAPGAGPILVERPLYAEDTRLFLAALGRAGFQVEESAEAVRLTPGPPPPPENAGTDEIEIFCGNAGTMLRFLVATLAVVPGRWRLDGTPRLRERPVGPLVEAVRRLGGQIEYLGRPGCVPLRIAGGSLQGGVTAIDAGESSQYLSALLMAGLAAPAEVVVEVGALTSQPYVEVTLAAAAAFGGRIERLGEHAFRVRPAALGASRVRVEGDWSAACYPAAAAALTGGDVRLAGVFAESRQGDRRFLDLLAAMGAEVSWEDDLLAVRGRENGDLLGIEADLSGLPDQVPTLAALGPFARGTTRITNVPHLRIKESDRLGAMASELGRVGAAVEEGADNLTVHGLWHRETGAVPPSGRVVIDAHDDHRIAMSMALVGLRRPGIEIATPEVVGKSYPEFWTDLQSLLR